MNDQPHFNAPTPETIIAEIRQGLQDNTLSDATQSNSQSVMQTQQALRKLAASTDVLGRCQGSLRGRLCLKAAHLTLPIVEQINAFTTTTHQILTHMEDQVTSLTQRVEQLEASQRTPHTANGLGDQP